MKTARRNVIWLAILFVVICVYVWRFSGWFDPRIIRVEHTIRAGPRMAAVPGQRSDPGGLQANSVTFSLHRNYRLTSVRVVLVADAETNKYPHALWHLVSEKGSTPVEGFAYGFPVQGMMPARSNAAPERLRPGMAYRLLIEAGSFKGTNDFSIATRSARR